MALCQVRERGTEPCRVTQEELREQTANASLRALIVIAAERGIQLSEALLQRDHSLDESATPFPELAKIAERHGMKARALKMNWAELMTLNKALPAALEMRNGATMVLEGIRPGGAVPVVMLSDPLDPTRTVVDVDEHRLAEAWTGQVLMVKLRRQARDADQPFGLGWLLSQVAREKALVRDIVVSSFALSIFALLPIVLFITVVDRLLTYQRESTLFVLSMAILFILVFDTAFGYMRRYLIAILTGRIDARISVYAFNRMIGLPIDFFERQPAGLIVYKISEVWRIRTFLIGPLLTAMMDLVTLVILVPVMFYLSVPLTLFALAIGTLMCVAVVLYIKPLSKMYGRVVIAEQQKSSFMIENIHGIRTVKSLALEEMKRVEWDARVAEAVRAHTGMNLLANHPQTILQPLEKLIFTGVLLFGCYLVITEQTEMLAGSLLAVTMMANRMAAPFVQTATMLQQYEEVRGALGMVASVVNSPPEQPPGRIGVRPEIAGHIVFNGLRFRYQGSEAYALDDLSFEIPKGKVIGIMGRSGSGKTTVTRLLQGLHRNYEGLVKIDGVDLREIDLNHLRSHIGVVLQDNFLFSGTIRDNIMAANRSASLEDVIRVARLSGAEEFIDRLPMGYETIVEEGSTNLSGGQKQRLAIARALLVDPKVLILDEATSALDPESETIVNRNLKRIAQGRTVIVVSHRLMSLVDCDKIMVMERGKLADMGSHAELLQRCEVYSHLWSQQNRNIA